MISMGCSERSRAQEQGVSFASTVVILR